METYARICQKVYKIQYFKYYKLLLHLISLIKYILIECKAYQDTLNKVSYKLIMNNVHKYSRTVEKVGCFLINYGLVSILALVMQNVILMIIL